MTTALDLKSKGWQQYLDSVHPPSPPIVTPEENQEREQLLQRLREAATLLKTRFGARRVILFGSLVHAAWFAPDSDVDVAVEGLPSAAYWRAWRAVEDLVSSRPVDFIELENAKDSLRQAIVRYGVEL